MKIILSILWFFLPAGLGNLAPILANKIPAIQKYTYPLDFHKKFRGKRIFGNHKTIRGLISGIIIGIITVYLQVFLYNHFQFFRYVSLFNYNHINPLLLGLFAASGALIGDAVKSFFKRQLNIPSGKSWFPFDQIDYILGGIIFTYFYIKLDTTTYIVLFIIWFLMHILSTFIGWLLRLKKDPI